MSKDNYDRLLQAKKLFLSRREVLGARFIRAISAAEDEASMPPPAGPSPPPPPPIPPIGVNHMTFEAVDDMQLRRWSGRINSAGGAGYVTAPAPWPPVGDIEARTIPSGIAEIEKDYFVSGLAATFMVSNVFLRFDTSALPDNALIARATLDVYITYAISLNHRSLIADWHQWTPQGVYVVQPSNPDWAATIGTNAGTALPTNTYGAVVEWTDLPLDNAAGNIALGGSSYLRLGISGDAPVEVTIPNAGGPGTDRDVAVNNVAIIGSAGAPEYVSNGKPKLTVYYD